MQLRYPYHPDMTLHLTCYLHSGSLFLSNSSVLSHSALGPETVPETVTAGKRLYSLVLRHKSLYLGKLTMRARPPARLRSRQVVCRTKRGKRYSLATQSPIRAVHAWRRGGGGHLPYSSKAGPLGLKKRPRWKWKLDRLYFQFEAWLWSWGGRSKLLFLLGRICTCEDFVSLVLLCSSVETEKILIHERVTVLCMRSFTAWSV